MTDQLTTRTLSPIDDLELTVPELSKVEPPHWTQHQARQFPRRTGEHAPNLATLDQLRANGRNALLVPRHRRRAKPAGCTSC
jgi:hypothetical protein